MEYPKFITYKGVKIPINWNFRIGIEFQKLLYEDIDDKEKFIKFLELYFNALPRIDDPELLTNEVLKFYRCGKESVEIEEYDEYEPRPQQAYSFEDDWPYIQAAFLQQYQVDLNTVEDLHWWQFKGMLESLNDTTQFKKILGYRLMKISKNMSSEQKAYYKEMKEIYKLPDRRTEEEIENDFASSFL